MSARASQSSCRRLADVHSPQIRSHNMARIRRADTKPEMTIRTGLHALGWRYRLGEKYKARGRFLPGKPDLVFPGQRAVIFVNGCFWHGHACAMFRWPATRPEFWRSKIAGNIVRDQKVRADLKTMGWRVLDVWECVLRGKDRQPAQAVLSECAEFLRGGAECGVIGVPAIVIAD